MLYQNLGQSFTKFRSLLQSFPDQARILCTDQTFSPKNVINVIIAVYIPGNACDDASLIRVFGWYWP